MAFPETRLTLIHRIAKGGDDAAWQRFLADYWRPICLFATRIGNLSWEDAEDVASQTIEVLNRKELISRWLATPRARFKTLLCGVTEIITAIHPRQLLKTRRQENIIPSAAEAGSVVQKVQAGATTNCPNKPAAHSVFEFFVRLLDRVDRSTITQRSNS